MTHTIIVYLIITIMKLACPNSTTDSTRGWLKRIKKSENAMVLDVSKFGQPNQEEFYLNQWTRCRNKSIMQKNHSWATNLKRQPTVNSKSSSSTFQIMSCQIYYCMKLAQRSSYGTEPKIENSLISQHNNGMYSLIVSTEQSRTQFPAHHSEFAFWVLTYITLYFSLFS